MKIYSGIGSQKTPTHIQIQQREIATTLEEWGYILRSGNAKGSDQAFAQGVEKNAIIWLPFKDFEKDFQIFRPLHDYRLLTIDHPQYEEAYESIKEFHPASDRLKAFGYHCMARNWMQLFGDNITSKFMVCWTENGEIKGGTGQALRIAQKFGIPVFNMGDPRMTKEEILQRIQFFDLVE